MTDQIYNTNERQVHCWNRRKNVNVWYARHFKLFKVLHRNCRLSREVIYATSEKPE